VSALPYSLGPSVRAFLAAIAALGVVAFGAAAGVRAQEAFPGTSYITPFPAGDTYRMQVYGDAFAEGLLGDWSIPSPAKRACSCSASAVRSRASHGSISTLR
jgi:hypothetical protein